MLGVLFHYEEDYKSIYSGSNFSFDLWRLTAKSFGADWYGMIDLTDDKLGSKFSNPDEEIQYRYYQNISEVIAEYKNSATLVGLETAKTLTGMQVPYSEITFYSHSASAIYITGPDSSGFTANIDDFQWITIPHCTYSLWAISAISIVLFDRKVKSL